MQYMFSGASKITNLNLNNFNVSKVTLMVNMFANTNSLATLYINNWTTPTATKTNMFSGTKSTIQVHINLAFDQSWINIGTTFPVTGTFVIE